MKSLNSITNLIFCSFFSLLITSGCSSPKNSSPLNGVEWVMPTPPRHLKVDFQETNNGLILTKTNALNLLKNIDTMQSYTINLETLIKEMKKYYNAKE